MIYLVTGTDTNKRVARSTALLTAMSIKRPDAQVITFDTDSFSSPEFEQHISGMGLFDDKSIVKLSGVLEVTEQKKYIIDHLADLQSSDNAFIFSENRLAKPDITKFEKAGAKTESFDAPTARPAMGAFDLADLLLAKNKQKLLIRWYEYIRGGEEPESLVGILVWQMKALCLAQNYSQKDSGLKPFVYNKSSKSKWSQDEALDQYFKLLTEYHESRRGGLPLPIRIEKFLLEL